MPKQKLSKGAQYLLDVIERLDKEDYQRLIGPGFRELTDRDLIYLREMAIQELSRRHSQTPASGKGYQPREDPRDNPRPTPLDNDRAVRRFLEKKLREL